MGKEGALVKPRDKTPPREGPDAGIYSKGGVGMGLGEGAPGVHLSELGQDPLCPWEIQRMKQRCPNRPAPLAKKL